MKRKFSCQLFLPIGSVILIFLGSRQAWAAPAATTTTLTIASAGNAVASGGSVASGSQVTLTAAVVSGSTMVTTGQVSFCDAAATACTDIHLLGTAQLTSAGTAVFRFHPGTGTGSYSYKAIFAGTPNGVISYAGSASSTVTLSVTGAVASTTTIAQSGAVGDYTLTATVKGQRLVLPTGIVSFLDSTNSGFLLGTADLGQGKTVLSWLNSQSPATGNGPFSIAVADFNGDGVSDLAVLDEQGGTVTTLLGNGNGTFTASPVTPTTAFPSEFVAVGDFNGDGIADLAVAGGPAAGRPGALRILLGQGDGTFTPAASPVTGSNPISIAVGDFNGDGIQDLAVANLASNTLTILLGIGDGTFTPAASPVTGIAPSSVAIGDFNGTGYRIWRWRPKTA